MAVKESLRKNLWRVRDTATKPETGSAPAANPSATPHAHLHPSRCTQTRTTTTAHLAGGFMQRESPGLRPTLRDIEQMNRPRPADRQRLAVRGVGDPSRPAVRADHRLGRLWFCQVEQVDARLREAASAAPLTRIARSPAIQACRAMNLLHEKRGRGGTRRLLKARRRRHLRPPWSRPCRPGRAFAASLP
jgi:hypothetical protein